jgi:hypothetical protein
MTEFTTNYSINGTSYAVLNDNTTDVAYNYKAKLLETSIVIEDTAVDVDDILLTISDVSTEIIVTINYTDPTSTVTCIVSQPTSIHTQFIGGFRHVGLVFDVTSFEVN